MIFTNIQSRLATILVSLSMLACANTDNKLRESGEKYLVEAIEGLSGTTECKESEFSTENGKILSIIKSRGFDIAEYSVDERDGETAHRFILKPEGSHDVLVAEVVEADGRCKEYTFGKIVD